MYEFIKDNTLIITNNKTNIIKYFSSLNKLLNIKVMTSNELISNYYFNYNDKTIYYLMKKYNIKYEIAKIYINNMYYVNESSDNKKINMIYEMKKDLIDNNLLIINNYFKDYLNSKNIVIYNMYSIPNIIKSILNNYKCEIINDNSNDYKHSIYEFNSLDDEVVFVAYKCIELIKSNIDINKIYLTNLNDEYRLIIKRIFSMFNIPILLNDNYSIYNTHTSNIFLDYYDSDINNTLTKLEESITKDEIDIYNRIVNICNKYVWCDDYLDIKELIINELKNTNISNNLKENVIKEIDIDTKVNDDEYVFLLGFNQGVIPSIKKDEDYFSDKDKVLLNMETSIDNNLIEKEKIINILSNIKNLTISYKLKTLTDTYSISNINEELEYEVIKDTNISYNYSNLYNKLYLSKSLDIFNKYGTITNDLSILYSNYPNIEYRTYNNKFKGINKDDLYKYLDNKILLSYSSLDNYNRCNFRFYLNNILKLSIYEETFMQFIGNLFHYILSKAFIDNFNYDEVFDSYIKDKINSKKEEYFIKKLKEELRFIIDTINDHNKYCSMDKEVYEEKVYVNLDGNIKVTFMGIIDKLKYKEIDNNYIVAIIDYKTGNPNLELNNIMYGIDMQLPIYIYLTRNYFNKNIEVAGFYLQKILNNEISSDGKTSYEDLKKKNLLLQGYSNSNTDILECFDNSYSDSNVVKSLKMTSKGFYSYSKVLDSKTIDKLVEITEERIKQSTNDILNAKYDINPKRIGGKDLGCEFCKFKDICYKTEKDVVNLKEYKNLEFLEGDANGMD